MKCHGRFFERSICIIIAFLLVISLLTPKFEIKAKASMISEVVKIAQSQVGYHEKASNRDLDDFVANAGVYNYTKHHRDLINWGNTWVRMHYSQVSGHNY